MSLVLSTCIKHSQETGYLPRCPLLCITCEYLVVAVLEVKHWKDGVLVSDVRCQKSCEVIRGYSLALGECCEGVRRNCENLVMPLLFSLNSSG